MKWVFLFLLIIVSVITEALYIRVPFFLIFLILYFIARHDESIFLLCLGGGLLLDSLTFRTLGTSSIFFIVFFLLLVAYQRKFEVNTMYFAIFSTIGGGACYLLVFGSSQFIIQLVVSIAVACAGFICLQLLLPKTSHFAS